MWLFVSAINNRVLCHPEVICFRKPTAAAYDASVTANLWLLHQTLVGLGVARAAEIASLHAERVNSKFPKRQRTPTPSCVIMPLKTFGGAGWGGGEKHTEKLMGRDFCDSLRYYSMPADRDLYLGQT
ncbi:hypothetical protein ElyMa_006963600 [Elysia marginata]|uniref:Uncharacterized protein n=1 Tax=Elysia marginata TaxID=1093978 RepID=A0AAV4JJD4_9GAST|nr:hypothetical protein ElyMa_006963600 [Elysia marginata]